MFLRNSKLIMILMVTSLLLAACGGSIEKNIIGSWKAVNDGEVGTYIQFNEERMVLRETSDDNPKSVKYILTETQDDNFILAAVDPESGSEEFLFEGYFENKDTIKPIENSEEGFGNSELIRVDNIEEDIAEEKEKEEEANNPDLHNSNDTISVNGLDITIDSITKVKLEDSYYWEEEEGGKTTPRSEELLDIEFTVKNNSKEKALSDPNQIDFLDFTAVLDNTVDGEDEMYAHSPGNQDEGVFRRLYGVDLDIGEQNQFTITYNPPANTDTFKLYYEELNGPDDVPRVGWEIKESDID